MDFELNDTQRLLQRSVSRALAERNAARAGSASSDADALRARAWSVFTELGLLGLPFSEKEGGFGGGAVEMMIVMQALGRVGSVEPYLATAILSGTILRIAASARQRQALLAPIIAGQTQIAFAQGEEEARYDLRFVAAQARLVKNGWVIEGRKTGVIGGDSADMFIVSARTEGACSAPAGITLFLLDAQQTGVTRSAYALRDGTRLADVEFSGARIRRSAMLGAMGGAYPVIRTAIDHALAALAAEALGAMESILDLTVEHLRTRSQFGSPIGSFQALQHRVAEMYVELEQARSLAMVAASALDLADADARAHAISLAKAGIGSAARFISQQGVQLHGGMGMTLEHPVGRLFRRLMVIERTFGDTNHHLAQVAKRLSRRGSYE